MITNSDIIKLAKVFVTKEDLVDIRDDIRNIKTSVNSLTTAVDSLAKDVSEIKTENMVIKHHLKLI